MYDAIVVGARCAGASTAMLLARRGLRVLLVDRVRFPSDTLSTHFIHVSGVDALARWGVLERVRASGCPPIREMSLDFGPFALKGRPPATADADEMFCCRRTVLDAALVEAAVEAGAELSEGFLVEDLVRDDDGRVCGIRGSGPDGAVTAHAPLVIGADGRHSKVAAMVRAPEYEAVDPLTCAYYSYWSGVDVHDAALYNRPGRAIAAMPTNDGLTCIFVAAPIAEFHAVRGDVDGHVHATLGLVPELAARVAAGRREERFRGTADLPNFLRRPHGDGWALVGDAGCHKDPVTAQGISDAFRDAELLADAVTARGGSLAAYEEARDAVEVPRYRLALQLASMEPPSPEFAGILGALPSKPEKTRQFLGLLAGTTPFSDFFSPANLAEILGSAPASG